VLTKILYYLLCETQRDVFCKDYYNLLIKLIHHVFVKVMACVAQVIHACCLFCVCSAHLTFGTVWYLPCITYSLHSTIRYLRLQISAFSFPRYIAFFT